MSRKLMILVWAAQAACQATPSTTEKPTPPAVDNDPSPAVAQPFLWRVTSPAGTFHLFGTVHLGVELDKSVPQAVLTAFDQAQKLVVETDITKVNPADLMTQENWIDALDEKERAALANITKMSPEQLANFEPFFVYTQLLSTVLPKTKPMDMELVNRARGAGKTLAYLEDPGFQLQLMKKHFGVEELKEAIGDMETVKKDLDDLIAAYNKGDKDGLWKVVARPSSMTEEQMQDLLVKRNKNWMPALKKLDKAFVAVGAAHLLGPEGLVALLQKEGFAVSRVAVSKNNTAAACSGDTATTNQCPHSARRVVSR